MSFALQHSVARFDCFSQLDREIRADLLRCPVLLLLYQGGTAQSGHRFDEILLEWTHQRERINMALISAGLGAVRGRLWGHRGVEDEAKNAVNPPTCQWQSGQAGCLSLPWASRDHQYNMHGISMAREFTCMISVSITRHTHTHHTHSHSPEIPVRHINIQC